MRYKVLKDGVEVRKVKGSLEFVQEVYPDHEYELIPPRPEPTHKTEFSPEELLNSFTSAESFASITSSNPAVKGQAELLGLRRNITISKDDAGYITSIEDLRSEGILDNDTADSYLLGIPLERLQ